MESRDLATQASRLSSAYILILISDREDRLLQVRLGLKQNKAKMFSASTLLKRRTDRDYINKPWNGRNEEIWTDPEDQQTSVCVQKFGRTLHPKQRQMLLVLYCCTVARYQNGNLELCNNLNNNPAPSCTNYYSTHFKITYHILQIKCTLSLFAIAFQYYCMCWFRRVSAVAECETKVCLNLFSLHET